MFPWLPLAALTVAKQAASAGWNMALWVGCSSLAIASSFACKHMHGGVDVM
jgi:hypothetical protein